MKSKTISIFRAVSLCLFLASIPLVSSQVKGYGVGARTDRYGANIMTWTSAILLAEHHQIPLYHFCDCHRPRKKGQIIKYKTFHRILEDYCQGTFSSNLQKKIICNIKAIEMLQVHPIGELTKKYMDAAGCNIPTGLKSLGLADRFFEYFDRDARQNEWQLRWDPEHALVIHVRLEDVSPEGSNPDHHCQQYIGDKRLQKLIESLHAKFPNHEIHLVTSPLPRDIDRCRRLTCDYPYVKGVWGDQSEDYALWQMMCSNILVFSRSTFCMAAGLLHRGEQCFIYEAFNLFNCVNGTGEKATWQVLKGF